MHRHLVLIPCVVFASRGALGRHPGDEPMSASFHTGGLDDVTPAEGIEALVRDRATSASLVDLRVYAEAYHAFDVASLEEQKTLRLLPLIGPKATLQYNEPAAVDAGRRLVEFLEWNALRRTR